MGILSGLKRACETADRAYKAAGRAYRAAEAAVRPDPEPEKGALDIRRRFVASLEVEHPCGFSFDRVICVYAGPDATQGPTLHDTRVLLAGENYAKAREDLGRLLEAAVVVSKPWGCISGEAMGLLGRTAPAAIDSDQGRTFVMSFPSPTKTGKPRKYPLSVKLNSFFGDYDLIAEMHYLPSGEPGRARVIVWSTIGGSSVGNLVDFTMDMGHLEPSCIEISDHRRGTSDWDRVWVREAR